MKDMIDSLQKRRAAADEAGFTLIELLIVIVILGVLAGIVVFAVGGINDNSKQSACKSDKKTVETAIEAYAAEDPDHDYPAAMGDMIPKYLKSAPDPTNGITFDSTTGVVSTNGTNCT